VGIGNKVALWMFVLEEDKFIILKIHLLSKKLHFYILAESFRGAML